MTEKNIRLLQVILMAFWPISAWASGESLGDTFGAINTADWLVVIVLSSVSGGVALLQRVRKGLEAKMLEAAGKNHDPAALLLVDIRFYAVCHMAASLGVGFFTFILCEYQNVDAHMEALLIAGCAWGGANVADKFADAAASRISRVFDKD